MLDIAQQEPGQPVVAVSTLDTKGCETAYLAERIRDSGLEVLVVDCGVLGEPLGIAPDLSSDSVAGAAGTTLEAVRAIGTRGAAVEIMARGLSPGLNPVSRTIFDNAAGAITGMVRARAARPREVAKGRLVAVTMLGNTTPGVMRLAAGLEAAGFMPVIFHSNGVGGPCREEMIAEGRFVGVIEPLGGLSIPNTPGGAFHDPEADAAFLAELRRHLRSDIPVVEVPAHINDPLDRQAGELA